MTRPKLRLFPLPSDVHRGPDDTDPRPVEEKNRADAQFSSGTGGIVAAAPEQPGSGGGKAGAGRKEDAQEKRRQDEQADEASKESFPASDPPAKY